MKTRFYLMLSVAIGLAACTIMQVSYDEGVTWSVYQEQYTYRTCHNHINWGWNGAQNGYFNHHVFNAYNYVQKDSSYYSISSDMDVNYYKNVKYFAVWR